MKNIALAILAVGYMYIFSLPNIRGGSWLGILLTAMSAFAAVGVVLV